MSDSHRRAAQPARLDFIICGQSDFAAAVIERVLERGHRIVRFICTNTSDQPDVAEQVALQRQVPVCRTASLGEAFALANAELVADIGVMAYVTLKACTRFLRQPTHGTIQYHPSLLPAYRGPSAINWAIINGERQTGFSIFVPNEVLDDGHVLSQQRFDILPHESAGDLYRRVLLPQGVIALVDDAEALVRGERVAQPQPLHQASYQGWCRRSDARIDFDAAASAVHDLIRGCDPRPGAWLRAGGQDVVICRSRVAPEAGATGEQHRPGEVVAIDEQYIRVRCARGMLDLLQYRDPAGRRQPARLLAEALCLAPGMRLGEPLGAGSVNG